MARRKKLSASEIMEQTRSETTTPHVYAGLIDQADDQEFIKFSLGVRCATWTLIPTDMIEKVELIRHIRCGDHTHPFVHLFLGAPASPEANAFAGISQQMASYSAQSLGGASFGSPGMCPPPLVWYVDPATGLSGCR